MNENNILQYINQLESNLGYSLEPSYATLTSISDHNNEINFNNQLALLRANRVSNPQATQTLQLENITNILNSASSLLPQTSTKNSSNKENAPPKEI
jgi:hypothetical protein